METQQKNNDGILKAALAVALLAIAFLGYLLFDAHKTNNEQTKTIDTKVSQLAMAQTRLDSISTQLDAKMSEIVLLGGKIDELQAVKVQLEKDKVALRHSGSFSAKSYDEKIKNYIALLSEKDVQIAQLRQENETLNTANKTLAEEKTTLVKEKETVVQENTGLQTDKTQLTKSVQEYTAKNDELAAKVKIASALRAQDITIYAITASGKEKDGGNYRAQKVDKLKFQFKLPVNPIAEKQQKEILVRVLDPQGAVVADGATGSGVFQFNGQELGFTTKQTIDFTNDNQTVAMYYARTSPYNKGEYKVELYSDGFKIGEGGFKVRTGIF